MIGLRPTFINNLTSVICYGYKATRKVASFRQRIKIYEKKIDRYQRQFHMRPPDLAIKNTISFPIKVPLLVRHRFKPTKRGSEFVDNSQKIHWNRLSPNEILLGFENLQYLQYNEMMEGLRYLSQVKGQQQHDWNSHPWVSKALEEVNNKFLRIKRTNRLPVYYLMKRLKYSNQDFWRKMYGLIEQNLYELFPSEFETFFLRYYKVSGEYFSSEMRDKFLTLLEGRIRSFSPEGIIKIYQIYQEEERLDDYWKYNVFIPLFKSQQYTFSPVDLRRIFRFMLVLGHEKDQRLYASLYSRLTGYPELSEEEIDQLQEVVLQVKDLFISHRVDPYLQHLKEMKKRMEKLRASKKKQIPIHELVRQDLTFLIHKKRLQNLNAETQPQPQLSSDQSPKKYKDISAASQ